MRGDIHSFHMRHSSLICCKRFHQNQSTIRNTILALVCWPLRVFESICTTSFNIIIFLPAFTSFQNRTVVQDLTSDTEHTGCLRWSFWLFFDEVKIPPHCHGKVRSDFLFQQIEIHLMVCSRFVPAVP